MKKYRVVGQYRRNVSSVPQLKRLIQVQDLGEHATFFGSRPGQLCPDVVFYVLERGDGSFYWGKTWLNERQWMSQVTLAVESFLRTLGQENLCLSVDVDQEFGMIYPFNKELFTSSFVVHPRFSISNIF